MEYPVAVLAVGVPFCPGCGWWAHEGYSVVELQQEPGPFRLFYSGPNIIAATLACLAARAAGHMAALVNCWRDAAGTYHATFVKI